MSSEAGEQTAPTTIDDGSKVAADPSDPSALFAQGLFGLFEPLVLELNDHIKNVFSSQENLATQLDHLTAELDRFNLTRAPPLDPYIERLQNLRKRVASLSSHIDKVYGRLERMNRNFSNYRQQSAAPPLRRDQPSSHLRNIAVAPPLSTIVRPEDPMAFPSPVRDAKLLLEEPSPVDVRPTSPDTSSSTSSSTDNSDQPSAESHSQPEPELQPEVQPEVQPELQPEPEAQPEAQPEPEPEAQPEPEPEAQPEPEPEAQPEPELQSPIDNDEQLPVADNVEPSS